MRRGNRGFTLVELLVVISVLGLLAGMVVPVLSGVMVQVKIALTTNQLAGLETNLHAYRDEFGAFPPSNPSAVADCEQGGSKVGGGYSSSGAENLYFFLRGWYIQGGAVKQGEGYKKRDLGGSVKDIDPYYTPSEKEWVEASDPRYGFGGAAKGFFIADKFDDKRPILYFKGIRSEDGNPFTQSHNSGPISKWPGSPGKSFDSFVFQKGIPRSIDFLVWSAGPDAKYLTNDDIIVP